MAARDMLNAVRDTIERFGMLTRDEHLLVAVSGGPDSVALLRALVLLSTEYRLHLTAAHLNHGLRGAEAEKEEDFVRHLSSGMGIPCLCKTIDIRQLQRDKGQSLEEVGREERYRFLKEAADKCGARKIATGHHRDDQAETVLINLIRGSGPEGLKGIVPVREGRIIRPLLQVSRKSILKFLEGEGLTYVTDSSNLNPVFLRNRIRNELIPALAKNYNPQMVAGLCHVAEIARREDDYLRDVVRQILDRWAIVPGAEELLLPLKEFMPLPEALQGRIIKVLLGAAAPSGKGIGYRHIEAVLKLCRHSQPYFASLDLPFRIGVEKRRDTLRIGKGGGRKEKEDGRGKLPEYVYKVEVPGKVYLRETGVTIVFEFVEKPDWPVFETAPQTAFMDYKCISPPLILRNVRPGDRIEPLGMRGGKKLKSYFIDRKIPRCCRRKIPLLVDSRSVIWIAGERISERVKVTPETRIVLKAEMTVS
jgi:tRNA(Ile)-lysidine synthase